MVYLLAHSSVNFPYFVQVGKDDSKVTSKHRKRSQGNNADTTNSPRLSTTASSVDASSGLDRSRPADNCLEPSVADPLSVDTQFTESPAGPISSGSTTDTASEVASLIHSPGEASSVSTVDSSLEGRIAAKIGDDDTATNDDKGNGADLDNRLAVAAQALTADDAVDTVSLTVGDSAEDEMSSQPNTQKSPPRFTNKVRT